MAGLTWPTLTAGAIARASDVVNRFQWMEGSIVPMSGGSATDNAFDLGSVTTNWRTIYAYSINGTSTAKGLAIGTTTVANQSDVAFEVAGIRSVVLPRLTTTQRTNLAGINGMIVYDSTLNLFQKYENGAWANMGGAVIGLVAPVLASTTSAVTTSAISVSAPGRLLRIMAWNPGGGSDTVKVQILIDSLSWGDYSSPLNVVNNYMVWANIAGPGIATNTSLDMTTTANSTFELAVFFKSTLAINYLRLNGGNANVAIFYERT